VSENADIARLSRKLATLDTSVPIDIPIEEFHLKEPDWPSLLSLFREFEFGSLMKLIPSEATRETGYETVLSLERLKEITSLIRDEIAFDTETTGRNPVSADLVGMSLCMQKAKAWYIPVAHSYPGVPAQIPKSDFLEILADFLERKDSKIGHNLKYDIAVLKQGWDRCKRTSRYNDCILSISPNKPNHSLEEVALEYLSYRKRTFLRFLKRSTFSKFL
jgi:DNA polymerase-1